VDLRTVTEAAWNSVESGDATLEVATTTVEADRGRLRQLVENLTENAVEHGCAGNPTQSAGAVEHGATDCEDLTVTVRTVDAGFYIADDEAGLPDDVVFEQGYTTDEDNTGLRLAIARRIADGHGWDIAVTDSDAGGARFEIRTV